MIVVLLAGILLISGIAGMFFYLYLLSRRRCRTCGYYGGFHAPWCQRGKPS